MYDAAEFFGKEYLTLYHGSPHVIERPSLLKGKPDNDYGRGFYCTESPTLACEWACPSLNDGCANEYRLSLSGLTLIDLADSRYNALNWLAVLLQHRTFEKGPAGWEEAREFVLDRYGVNLDGADLIHGYRADDSYFSFARDFLTNRLPLNALERALFLGGLGYQIVLKTQPAFDSLEFVGYTVAEGMRWNPLRMARDAKARAQYHEALTQTIREGYTDKFIIDIMREEA